MKLIFREDAERKGPAALVVKRCGPCPLPFLPRQLSSHPLSHAPSESKPDPPTSSIKLH